MEKKDRFGKVFWFFVGFIIGVMAGALIIYIVLEAILGLL